MGRIRAQTPRFTRAVSIAVETPNPAIVTDPADQRAISAAQRLSPPKALAVPPGILLEKRYGTNLLNGAKFSGVNTPR